jgi:cobalamin-dependent methionine synthase I/methionine synthase I (cobalamin-dependent)
MKTRETLDRMAAEKVLILDGAMGSMIQAFRSASGEGLGEADFRGGIFEGHGTALMGCNDVLCLTRPDVITGIHEAYLRAGADIIETCSFNANAISLGDYGLGERAYEISAAAAALARKAADGFSVPERRRFVAGSMGPSSKSAGISLDMNDPAKRAVSWDDLEGAYYDNARGLLDGGADMFLVETVIDSINAKAALFAIHRLLGERGMDVPVMISASVANAGRLLTGQTLEAFCVSVLHGNPWSIGLNCSFGAERLKPHLGELAAFVPCLVSAYPNAGMPNRLGEYDDTPEFMAACIETYLKEGLVNIVGGCCGSTPAHIAAIAAMARDYRPRTAAARGRKTFLAGTKSLAVGDKPGLVFIGERTNVGGSKEFLEFIKEGEYDEALDVARDMIESGAAVVDVCMDDALLDPAAAMRNFINMAACFSDVAELPVMIDSSRWEVIEEGLKCLPGKGLVNSISLKDGVEEFLRKARLVRAYGAAAVVALFDEQGQAVSYERKIEIAARSWLLLTNAGFPPEDIVFDPNVLAVATGIPEHDARGADFIRACSWIRKNCPGCQISGGISNLSFSFRGNNRVREAMHRVFLKHAGEAGLTMAIINPAGLVAYDDIDAELREAAEDVILNRGKGGAEKLLAIASSKAAAERHESLHSRIELTSLEEARKNRAPLVLPGEREKIPLDLPAIFNLPRGPEAGESPQTIVFSDYPLDRVIPYMDWRCFLQTWNLAEQTYPSAYSKPKYRDNQKKAEEKLLKDGKKFLKGAAAKGLLRLRGVIGFFPACSQGDDIVLFEPSQNGGAGGGAGELARFCFPRNQEKNRLGGPNPCLSDFIVPGTGPTDRIGLFVLSAGFSLKETKDVRKKRNAGYDALLLASLANILTEAFSEEVHLRLKGVWGNSGIRPAFGYPACPDHQDKRIVFELLHAREQCGLELTESAMIIPAASVCGLYFSRPASCYFSIGILEEDQIQDWAARKGITPEEARRRLGRN